MTRLGCFLALVVLATIAPAQAEPLYLSGTVGKAPVLVTVERKGSEVSGWYLYLRHGKQIRLEGNVEANGALTLREYSPGGSAVTANFSGTVRGTTWSGTWKAVRGQAPVAFALNENLGMPVAWNGNFSCSGRQVDGELGWTFTQSMKVSLARGNVTRLEASHSAVSLDGDEQLCGIKLGDMDRTASRTGVLFRAKGDTPGSEGGHCSVRLVAIGDYLYLQMGDFTEDGNDCRSSGDTMYCTPRGNWNDLILNRKTGACTMVQ